MSDRTTLVEPLSGKTWRVPNNRLDPWHIIDIRQEGWRLTHPLTCDLDQCEFNDICEAWTLPPARVGSYRWMEPDGNFVEVDDDE